MIATGARIEREALLAARCAMREGAMKTRDAATALIVGDCDGEPVGVVVVGEPVGL